MGKLRRINGAIHIHSEVEIGTNWEMDGVVELRFSLPTNGNNSSTSVVVVDRPTAARLINQLRRALDEERP